MASDPAASDALNAILVKLSALHDEVAQVHAKLNNHSRATEARFGECRADIESVRASVRINQAGISDISELLNTSVEKNQERKRWRLDSDPLRRWNVQREVKHSTPEANVSMYADLATAAPVQVVEAEFAKGAVDAKEGVASDGDKGRRTRTLEAGRVSRNLRWASR